MDGDVEGIKRFIDPIYMNKMRLRIATTGFFPKEQSLGISNTVFLISRNLIKRGVDVSIYTMKTKGTLAEEEFEGIKIHRFGYTKIVPGIDYNVSIDMFNALKAGYADIIHSFHYAYYPATAGFAAAGIKCLPHIFTTSYHPAQLTALKTLMMRLYNVTQGKFILKGSFKTLPQNTDELNHLRRIASFDHAIVPCPLNEDVFYPRKKAGVLTVLFVGTMVPWKGAGIAFDICRDIERDHKNVRFVFIGDGFLRKELMKRASKRFVFLRNISNQDLALWYSKADVFLYPTKYESFGRVLAEAQLSGAPIVTTRVGGVPETVGSAGFLVDYGDWDRMKEYTIRLLTDNALRKRASRQSIKHAQQYKSKLVTDKIYRIYKRALAN